jgi:hypothetical protein
LSYIHARTSDEVPVGLFDFFSGGKGSNVKRTVAKATSKDAQSVDRWKAMEQLRDDGSEEALAGLLRRFTFNYDKSIEDEQEKQWVHDTLVEMAGDGEAESRATVLSAVEHAAVHFDSIAWPLKILEHAAAHDEAWPILEKVIAANDNEYVRDPSRKIQLIDFLGEWHDGRAARALLTYLEDVDEGVRFHTVEALLHQKEEEVAREPLLQLALKPDEESRRIKIRVLDGLADLGWNTHGYKGQVEKLCEDIGRGHSIDGKGRIRKSGKA